LTLTAPPSPPLLLVFLQLINPSVFTPRYPESPKVNCWQLLVQEIKWHAKIQTKTENHN